MVTLIITGKVAVGVATKLTEMVSVCGFGDGLLYVRRNGYEVEPPVTTRCGCCAFATRLPSDSAIALRVTSNIRASSRALCAADLFLGAS